SCPCRIHSRTGRPGPPLGTAPPTAPPPSPPREGDSQGSRGTLACSAPPTARGHLGTRVRPRFYLLLHGPSRGQLPTSSGRHLRRRPDRGTVLEPPPSGRPAGAAYGARVGPHTQPRPAWWAERLKLPGRPRSQPPCRLPAPGRPSRTEPLQQR